MDSNTLATNAGTIARLVAGVLGGAIAARGYSLEQGTLEQVIGLVLVAAAGVWGLIKNAKKK